MTRVLMILFNRMGKGTYWRALGYAAELVKGDFEVTILTAANASKLAFVRHNIRGVNVIETPNLAPATGYDPWDAIRRLHWLRNKTFDLIHAFESRPIVIIPALRAQKRWDVPLIMDWCDWFGKGGSVEERQGWSKAILRWPETYFEENFRNRAHGTTVINTILRDKAIALGVPADQILHIRNGADVETMVPRERSAVRAELGLPTDTPLLAYTGAIFHKDAALMAATFDMLCARHPTVKLLLIGYFNAALETMVAQPERVIRTGPVSYRDLAKYVAAADVGWLPLANSGANQGRFPMKSTDFMAAGQPLVVTEVGDLGSMVRHGRIGLVTSDEPAAQTEALLQLLREPQTRGEMARRGRAMALSQFAWPVVAAQLASFYRRVLNRYKSSR